ncbi:hypothetical protein Lal_00037676 [Lupinus albus]|nr:hypothetical protein Lal_00037676 [Lupinus albus]
MNVVETKPQKAKARFSSYLSPTFMNERTTQTIDDEIHEKYEINEGANGQLMRLRIANFRTMKITGRYQKRPLHTLIESGITHNFLDIL